MDKNRIYDALYDYGQTTIHRMAKALKDTDRLKDSLEPIITEDDKGNYTLSIKMPGYAIFVDEGRRPGAKMPPEKPIADWIKQKGISQFRIQKSWKSAGNRGGRFISNSSRLFLIRRAIGRDGIKPRPFMNLLSDNIDQLLHELGPAVAAEYAIALQISFNNAGIGE